MIGAMLFPFQDSTGPSRRAVLAGFAALAATSRAASAAVPVIKLGTLPLGTATWEAAVIKDRKLDAANGVSLDVVKLATNEAARIAFIGRSVDTIVGDLIFAARLRAEGKNIHYLPYSTAEGGLMVPKGSAVTDLAALKGKSIGIAGGPLDKNWILLRAAALEKAKLDLEHEAKPVFGAPPLLSAKLEQGELDSALLYWNFCARLEAKGFKQVTNAQALAGTLGAPGKVAMIGYLFHEETDPAAVLGFAKASRVAKALLASQPDAWEPLRRLMEAQDDATFDVLRQGFVSGIPQAPRATEIADAKALFALLAKLGGERLVGPAKSLPEGLYVDQPVYG